MSLKFFRVKSRTKIGDGDFRSPSPFVLNFCYRLPVAAYCLLIFWQSAFPSPQGLPDFAFSDKFMHLGGYALLGALFFRALIRESIDLSRSGIILLSIFFSTLYGVSDEIHQAFVSARCGSVGDVLADCLGSALGVWFYACFCSRDGSGT